MIVAYTVWKCRLCGHTTDRDSIASHLQEVHKLQSVEMFKDRASSPNIKYPAEEQLKAELSKVKAEIEDKRDELVKEQWYGSAE